MDDVEQQTVQHIEQEWPGIKWLRSYVSLGPHDYLDAFSAPILDVAIKVPAMMHTFGRSYSEVWSTTE